MNNNIKLQNMEETKNNTGQNLGIAALITAIITFVLAVIPCVGLIAIIPGIIAIVLASVGLSNAARTDSPRGVLLAGLIIAIVASLISFSQVFVAGKIAEKADKWPKKIEEIVTDVQENVIKDLEDANISIKIESGDDKIEIKADANKKDREQTLEELEEQETGVNDSVNKK
jgi:hypothetical protein